MAAVAYASHAANFLTPLKLSRLARGEGLSGIQYTVWVHAASHNRVRVRRQNNLFMGLVPL